MRFRKPPPPALDGRCGEALVGAGGLGVPVVRALNTVQVGMGFEAGFVIVLLAIILDRISRTGAGSGKS